MWETGAICIVLKKSAFLSCAFAFLHGYSHALSSILHINSSYTEIVKLFLNQFIFTKGQSQKWDLTHANENLWNPFDKTQLF